MELLSSSYKKSTRLINSVICSSRPCPHPVKASPSPKAAPMEGNILDKPASLVTSHAPILTCPASMLLWEKHLFRNP